MSHHMRMSVLLSAIILAVGMATACDDPVSEDAPDACPSVQGLAIVEPDAGDDGVSLREQSPPAGIYISTLKGLPIRRAEFMAVINACKGQSDPKAILTLSWYQPDTTKPERVMGLAESVTASPALWQCYVNLFMANNPTKI